MKLRPETLRHLRTVACDPNVTHGTVLLNVDEARQLYEDYTSARMFEGATETLKRQLAAAETREAALETRAVAAETKLAAAMAAERMLELDPFDVCPCDACKDVRAIGPTP